MSGSAFFWFNIGLPEQAIGGFPFRLVDLLILFLVSQMDESAVTKHSRSILKNTVNLLDEHLSRKTIWMKYSRKLNMTGLA